MSYLSMCTVVHTSPHPTSYLLHAIRSLLINSSTLDVLFWSSSLVCCAILPSSCWYVTSVVSVVAAETRKPSNHQTLSK